MLRRNAWVVTGFVLLAVVVSVGIAYSTRGGGGSKDESVAEASSMRPAIDLGDIGASSTGTDAFEQDMVSEHVVLFPDGEQRRVRVRSRPADTIRPPDVLIDEYDSLRTAAESGNAEAGWRLYRALEKCQRAYSDEKALAEALDTLNQTHTIVWPDGTSGHIGDPAQMSVYESLLKEPFEACRGISAAQKEESMDWLEKSAKDGNLRAALRLGEILGNTKEGLYAMQAAWLSGHIIGALRLSELYRNGYTDGKVLVKDDIAAHAHLYVFSQLMEPAFPTDSRNAAQFKAEIRAELQKSADELYEHELDLAIEQAKAILEANENCCYKMAAVR